MTRLIHTVKRKLCMLLMALFPFIFSSAQTSINNGPGGPILVISQTSNPFSSYTVEMLRAEGLNEFSALDISSVTPAILNQYDVVIAGQITLTDANVAMLTDWVNAGGTLITFRPDPKLSFLLGLTATGNKLADKYLFVNTSGGPGFGIVSQTIQYHGAADLYTLSGATSIATLYSNASTPTTNPAVTTHSVGTNGGVAVAFTYDLAKSVVYTRQGNPAWVGQKRDGAIPPRRSDDLFFGNASFDPQPDWVDFSRIAIPQADEQQRLLTNIILENNFRRRPLPRFWFLPRGLKAAVVMTGDDHARGGTVARFKKYFSLSPSNTAQAVADWTAIRGTSYMYPGTPITDSQASVFQAQGFEIALHLTTNCADWTPGALDSDWVAQVPQLQAQLPGMQALVTNRTHCIAWSDWASQPKIEAQHGIRLDANYYYWPGAWVLNRPGMFTGSGMPMRFADLDGTLIDCYQLTTQMTDENTISDYSGFCNQLLDKAIGPEGYYGVFCANMHTDDTASAGSDAIIASAMQRQVPVISSRQMLEWLDGRNNSSFDSISWNGNQLQFGVKLAGGAHNIQAMVPANPSATYLVSLTMNGSPVAFTTQVIKGINYAFFFASTGNYVATYAACTKPAATIAPVSPAVCVGSPASLQLTAATGQAPFSLVVNGVTYNNVNVGQSFATLNLIEKSVWGNSGTPSNPSVNDNQPVELGVKFLSSADGYITGIRFYKGSANSGTHIGSLWSASGTKLATATFTNETSNGWQEVHFATPVAIKAGTVYVASYFTPTGFYAFDANFFGSNGVTNDPLTALQAGGVNGANGVFKYGGGFPTGGSTSNYWVDVLFTFTTNITSLNYTLSSITSANGCSNTDSALGSGTIAIHPLPDGTLAAPASVCAGQVIPLTFIAKSGTGPFGLVINGNTYNNVISGTPFSSGVQSSPINMTNNIWDSTAVPGTKSVSNDNSAVELGVKFRSSVAGKIAGIRFYKGTANTGVHTGSLWTTRGALLASATFTGETANGWQQVLFDTPVSVSADTTYIASYHAQMGSYAYDANYFGSSGVTKGPLTALQSGVDGPNGVFKYGNGGFPDGAGNANYWVDVVLKSAVDTFSLTSITDSIGCSRTGVMNTILVQSPYCTTSSQTGPVNLKASVSRNNATLNWAAPGGQNNHGFELERSIDGTNWTTVGFIDAMGESDHVVSYNFVDKGLAARQYYYRLKQTDIENQYKLSNIAGAKVIGKIEYELEQNHPNPFTQSTIIQFTIPETQRVKLSLYNVQGRLVKVLLNESKSAGTYSVNFNVQGISSGIYYYKLDAGHFTDTKKMVIP